MLKDALVSIWELGMNLVPTLICSSLFYDPQNKGRITVSQSQNTATFKRDNRIVAHLFVSCCLTNFDLLLSMKSLTSPVVRFCKNFD